MPFEWIALKSTSEIVGDRAGIAEFDHCVYSCPLVACCTCHPCSVFNTAKKISICLEAVYCVVNVEVWKFKKL